MKRQFVNRIRNFLLVLILFSLSGLNAQNYHKETYPKIGMFQWSGSVPEWYARHDFIMTAIPGSKEGGAAWARDVQSLNPNIILMPTIDWNYGSQQKETVPEEWYLRTSTGEKLSLYGDNTGLYRLNISDYCPRVNGKRYNEYIAEWMLERVDLNYFAGIATDGLHGFPWGSTDVDYDRNGVNDFDEHGRDWVGDVQTAGSVKALSIARDLIGPDKLLLVNSGGLHSFGLEYTNGAVVEYFTNVSDFGYMLGQYRKWDKEAASPNLVLFDGQLNAEGGKRGKNNFRDLRFGLGFTLLYGGYFNGRPQEGGEHYYTTWYDEFELELGRAKADPQQITQNVYARFFDNGVVVVNGSNSDFTVQNSHLTGLSGYDGPYYFFQGGQNPGFNDGSQFISKNLVSFRDGNYTEGDAIILLNSQKVVVADIIVDDSDAGTTPSAEPIRIEGNWNTLFERDQYDDVYTMRVASWHHATPMSAMFTTDAGNGSSKATVDLNIGVGGAYEVFEWHGYIGDNASSVKEGTNVPHRIVYSGGENSVNVDQSQNSGRWNSLGVYNFKPGSGQYIQITNNANGPVMADAFKLVFKSASGEVDVDPPREPSGVKAETKDNN